jgi:hypothetical protein
LGIIQPVGRFQQCLFALGAVVLENAARHISGRIRIPEHGRGEQDQPISIGFELIGGARGWWIARLIVDLLDEVGIKALWRQAAFCGLSAAAEIRER